MKYRFLRFPEWKTKAVTLSYDDGAFYDVKLVEIMNRYGLKGTFNLNGTGFEEKATDGRWRITRDEALSLYFPNGHDVAVHGEQHMALIKSAAKDGIREVLNGRAYLENFFGRIIRGMAYPDIGKTNDEIVSYLKMLGIVYARITESTGKFDLPTDWLRWSSTCRHADAKLMEYVDEFLAADPLKEYVSKRDSLLFYMWGHSFEFERDNNWDVMERFAQKISQKDDIWYANNTQIYEYIHAYESLIFSADNTMIYNPTHFVIYFEADCKNYVIQPNETLPVK